MYGYQVYNNPTPEPRAYRQVISRPETISHDLPQATSPYLNRPRRDLLEALFDYSSTTHTSHDPEVRSRRLARQRIALVLADYAAAKYQRERDKREFDRYQFAGWIVLGLVLGLLGCIGVVLMYGVPNV